MTTHRKYTASAAHRWSRCTASHALEAAAPDSTSSYAAEGTAAHEVAAAALRRGTMPQIGEYIVATSDDGVVESIEVTPEIHRAVSVYFDYVSGLLQSGGRDLRVEYSADIIPPEIFGGTTDCCLQRIDTLHVIDYKHGVGVDVLPENNRQLIVYALACLPVYSTAKQVCLTIIQPRSKSGGEPIKSWRCSVNTIKAEGDLMLESIRRIETGNVEFCLGSHCKFCRAATRCLAQHDMVSESHMCDPIHVLNRIDEIRALCNAVEAETFDRLSRGETIPGWKLVTKRTTSRWADGAFEALRNIPGATETRLIGITEFRKLAEKELVDQWVEKTSGGLTLAKESDKRPAAIVTAGFEPIEQEWLE